MNVIVGLGNPETKYFKTYHNLGFTAVGDCAAAFGVKFKKKQCESVTALVNKNSTDILLVRPLTYMNSSGRAVKQILAKYHLGVENLIVIYDDWDLPKGKIRIRKSGSAGTHNGMRSIIGEIEDEKFVRIRIGIKDPDITCPLIDYVLSEIKEEDYEIYIDACQKASDAALRIASGESIDLVIQDYNRKN